MCVIECEIGGQKLRLRRTDSTGSGAEVEDGVVEIEPDLKVLDRLGGELISKKNIPAACFKREPPPLTWDTTHCVQLPEPRLGHGHVPMRHESRDCALQPNRPAPLVNKSSWDRC